MRILFLTQIIPFPPDAGPKVKTWNVLRYLADQGHHITLASFVRSEEEEFVASMKEVCDEVYTVPIRRSRVTDLWFLFRSLINGRPFLIERDDLPGMRDLVQRLLQKGSFDCIHADQLTMAQFALPAPSPRDGPEESRTAQADLIKERSNRNHSSGEKGLTRIFDAHNAVWTIVERMGQSFPWILKPLIRLESRRVKAYEGMVVRKFDHTFAVTEIDREDLLQAVACYEGQANTDKFPNFRGESVDITVVPIAVDTTRLKPIQRQPDSRNLLTLGTLHYPPNAEGVRWFARNVFPLIRKQIPEATLTIVGKNPPQDLVQLAAAEPEHIKVLGYVPDLNPCLEQSAMIIVPVNAGSGMRVRILEAFAHAMPVVTTTIGLEGINAVQGEDVFVADDPHQFATAIVDLLENRKLQERLAINGRRLALEQYDWKVALKKLDAIYSNGVSNHELG